MKWLFRGISGWAGLVFFLLLLMCSSVFAKTSQPATLNEISHRLKGDGNELFVFSLSAAVEPKIFMIKGGNPRLVVDFPDCTYKGPNSVTLPPGAMAEGLRTGFHSSPVLKTRVVIDLANENGLTYTQSPSGKENVVNVTLIRPPGSKPAQAAFEEGDDTLPAAGSVSKSSPALNAADANGAPSTSKGKTEATQHIVVNSAQPGEKQGNDASAGAGQPSSPKTLATEQPGGKPVPPVFAEPTEKAPSQTKQLTAQLEDVSVDLSSRRGEMVLFHLNDFYPPKVSALEQDNPQVICEFVDTSLGNDVPPEVQVDGKFVKQILISHNKEKGAAKVTLQLAADRDYDLQQVFFKNDNLFVLIVNELPPSKK